MLTGKNQLIAAYENELLREGVINRAVKYMIKEK